MFDANARHLPDGKLFFAECHSVSKDNKIMNKVLSSGSIYLCKKIGKSPENCEFHIYLNKTQKDYYIFRMDFDSVNFDYESLFVYSGCPDGTGFICDTWRQKAWEFLGERWYE